MTRGKPSSQNQIKVPRPRTPPKLPDSFTCGICGEKFTWLAACTEHMKTHTRTRRAATPTAAAGRGGSCGSRPGSSSVSMTACSPRSITAFSPRALPATSPRPQTAVESPRKRIVSSISVGGRGPSSQPSRALSAPANTREKQQKSPRDSWLDRNATPRSVLLVEGSTPTSTPRYQKGDESSRSAKSGKSPRVPRADRPTQSGVSPRITKQTGEYIKEKIAEEGEAVYACFLCQAEFPGLQSLYKHWRVHDGSAPYSCTYCGRMFALYSTLVTHEKSHSPDQPPAHRCRSCGTSFLHQTSLKAHQRRHDDLKEGPESKPYQCATCTEWMSNEGSLRIHMQRHEDFAQAPRICSQCGVSFSSDVILRAHGRYHEAEASTRCVICVRRFRRSKVLLRHSDVHAEERQNVCDTCDRRFPKVADGSWRRMQRLLPQERPFRCLYCGDSFARLHRLAAHELGHTVPLPVPPPGQRSAAPCRRERGDQLSLPGPVVVVVN